MKIFPIPNHSTLPDLPSAVIADHTEFLDLGGTRPMTGNLNMDDNAITNIDSLAFDYTYPASIKQSGFGFLGITGTVGELTKFQLFNNNGAGYDTSFEIFGRGTISSTVDYERLIIGWDESESFYRIATNSKNDGSPRPLHFYVDGQDTGQLVLSTDGDIYMSGDLAATGAIGGSGVTDGTAILSGGNLTGMGNISGTDVDIGAGTGDYTTTGDITDGTYSNTIAQLATASINFVIDGGGAEIADGEAGHIRIPFACTIISCTMLADQSGSIVVDIWKDTYANFPPDNDDSITDAGTSPTITTAVKSEPSIASWTVAIAAGDVLAYNVDSCTTIERCTIELKVIKDNA